MRLLFISNTRGNKNPKIKSILGRWLGEEAKIGYVPSSSDPTRKYFAEVEEWFQGILKNARLFYLGIHDRKIGYEELLEFDCLYLSGGNTYSLISGLGKSGAGEALKKIAESSEKPIIGVSAGGIVLTPDIRSAEAENDLGVTDFRGLALVDFGFYPHFKERSKEDLKCVKAFLDRVEGVEEVYALLDHSGLVWQDGVATPLGPVFLVTR
ncbi:MAG: Type 1 glutamine amidotransferase-like domain-containing protein [candidate division WWE3 bacterium]|nr:Type 1 glutamine amidotransferase-like domain-containing protein [candidate division WWE3 bacterium]